MLHPIQRLELAATQRPGLRRLGSALKYLSPLFASGTMAALYLTTPGALTYANLALYALTGLAVGGLGSREVSRTFHLAAKARLAAGLCRDLIQANQITDQLRWSKNALADRLKEFIGETEVAEMEKVPFDGHNIFVRKLGEGGMAVAVQIKNLDLGGKMSVWKLPLPALLGEAAALSRFKGGEAATMVDLSHPNLVRFFDLMNISGSTYLELLRLSGTQDYESLRDNASLLPAEVPCIKMEFVQGQSLDKMIESQGRLAPALAVQLAIDIAAAADYVGQQGVIHRDLKPENVMIVTDEKKPDSLIVKIMDFGLAKQTSPVAKKTDLKLTQAGHALGTPYYMSPEQWLGVTDIDWRADQYASGVMLFEMLTGQLPFRGEVDAGGGEDLGSLVTKVRGALPPDLKIMVPGLPDNLVETVNRMLAKNRDDRFASWAECLTALRAVFPA